MCEWREECPLFGIVARLGMLGDLDHRVAE
jgi:hypothetical protein